MAYGLDPENVVERLVKLVVGEYALEFAELGDKAGWKGVQNVLAVSIVL